MITNFVLLLLKNMFSIILFILKLRLLKSYDPVHDLSWWMYHALLKRMCILLFGDVLFCGSLLGDAVPVIHIFTYFVSISSINCWKYSIEKIYRFVYFWFVSFYTVYLKLCYSFHTHLGFLYSFNELILLLLWNFSPYHYISFSEIYVI